MNAERMINMVIRMFMRRGVNMAIDSGLKAANRRGRGDGPVDDNGMSREDKQRMREQKQAIRKARRASRMAGKIGKL